MCYLQQHILINICLQNRQYKVNMKSGLKRIEATLHDLTIYSNTTSYSKSVAAYKAPVQARDRVYSFEINSAVQQQIGNDPQQTLDASTPSTENSERQSPIQKSFHKEPELPQINKAVVTKGDKRGTAAHHSNLVSHHKISTSQPDSKVKSTPPHECETSDAVLNQTDVGTYQAQLQEIVRQIQDIYIEGPIVDGWLESYPRTLEPRTVTLSNESADHLLTYVEDVYCIEKGMTCESLRPGYRLCGADADGQRWSRPCPLDQLPSVSIAIGRYQRLQQLLERKQYFELLIANCQLRKINN